MIWNPEIIQINQFSGSRIPALPAGRSSLQSGMTQEWVNNYNIFLSYFSVLCYTLKLIDERGSYSLIFTDKLGPALSAIIRGRDLRGSIQYERIDL
jgi:hypothetical protein